MEFPPFNHHNNNNNQRYVLLPPPPVNNFPDDRPNLYTHHHLIHLPPPPPGTLYPTHPPPPPPLSVPPPQPSYNPHFTFLDAQNSFRVSNNNQFNRFDSSVADSHHRVYSSNSQSGENYLNLNLNSSSRYKDRFVDRIGTSSRNLEDNNLDNYEPRYKSISESQRIWDPHGDDEDPKWVMNKKKKKNGRDYEYESSKSNRVREGREEFKQVQKKSVLLRIGKPNNTSRNNKSKGNVGESKNSNSKGKDKGKDSSLYKEKKKEEDREGSPVDLDVSFKSNTLVAKAVVTPPSPLSDKNKTHPRNRKGKRADEFNSPISKFGDHSTQSAGSPHRLDSLSSSGKASKDVGDKKSGNDGVDGSLSGRVVDEGGGNGGPGRYSFRLKQKRRPVLVAAVASSFQFPEKHEKPVKSKNVKSSTITPKPGAIPFTPLEKLVSSKVNESPKAMSSEKDGLQVENPSLGHINSFGDESTESKNLTEQKVSTVKDGLVIDLNQQLSENEVSLNLDSDTEKISADVERLLGGTEMSVSSGQDQIKIQNPSTKESYANFDAANVSYSLFDDETVKVQERNTTHEMITICSSSEEIIIISPEVSDVQDSFDISRKENKSELLDDSSKETCFKGSIEFLEDGPKGSPTDVIISEDNAVPSSSHKQSSFDKDVVPLSVQTPSPDHRQLSTDETYMVSKDDLQPSMISSSADTGGLGTHCDKIVESILDLATNIASSVNVSSSLGLQTLTSKSADKTISDSCLTMNDDTIRKNCESKDGALSNGPESFVDNSRTSMKSSQLEETKTVSSLSQGSSVKTLGPTNKIQKHSFAMIKPSHVPAVPRVFAGRSTPVFTNSRIIKPATSITKPRTWHRSTSNPIPPPPKQIGLGQNSYVRSGNSLVRKGSPVTAVASVPPASNSSVYQLNPSGQIETRNSAGSGSQVHSAQFRTGGSSAPVVRPNTPPLSGSTKLPDFPAFSRDIPSSPLDSLPASPAEENFSVQKVPEDQIGTSSKSESRKTLDEGAAVKKIHYVKRKSNQLVAASSSDQSIHELDNTQPSTSDSYYKRRKNQLVRTSMGDDLANTDVLKASKVNIKLQSGKGVSKKFKHLVYPSVWTLSSQSSRKDGVSLHQKLRPHLFPWKRSRNWGNLMNISAFMTSSSSPSLISRKLLLSRKRETLYTRSKRGFSLRMSKVLSVGGSGLKWSKSIERNSRRANEEATLAVAAAEKKRREQSASTFVAAETKKRNNTSRDRIFRIGLVRYKMDPSGRTILRISDDDPSTSVQSKEETRRPYVPKRLNIGHDEYVRIGNGNQLVRNPKRRTRIFASEKVRWSLHTVRSRFAKKKKYCQFFTRFGKCNKDAGKCPYIHDSSKVAVCTKFLAGSCSNTNCKLTHKVIPERMQDCSYFLQGLCSNKDCSYRHVNVNSAASVCEGFLKGYCADGNECRKKHTYACPAYEATGACSQGTKCKLHHPKNRKMGSKRKRHLTEPEQKNSRGRYFGAFRAAGAMPVFEKHQSKDDNMDIFSQEGKLAEYISLGFRNEGAGEMMSDQRTMLVSEPSGLGTADDDELIKPIRIMKRIVPQ
uniref:uncharacterized protein At1g21580 n=1 Tax=Erigeron canadensis TaxID=72917 RepID=UPI001CB89E39|nr:uncharacterized protein At1g21580 [Erigeron canadensis]